MKSTKKFELVCILELIKSGKSPAQISKDLNISKTRLHYHVDKLKKRGCIRKVGYGTWEFIKEVQTSSNLTIGQGRGSNQKICTSLPKREIRGHAFIWKIQFLHGINWEQKIRHSGLKFQLIFNKKVSRIIFENRKIWLTKDGLIIYEPFDFFGKSSFEVKGRAVFEMDRLIKKLLKRINIPFMPYRFTTSREHFGLIKNALAQQYNDRKEKLKIKGEDGTTWLWIDDSESLGELETAEPHISRQVQNWWNNKKKHKFKINDDFILNGFAQQQAITNQVLETQTLFAKNIKSHIGAIQKLAIGVEELTNQVKLISKQHTQKRKV